MLLPNVVKDIDFKLISGDLEKEITSVEFDSRKVTAGSMFVCVQGFTVDGHSYAGNAIEQGAGAIVVDSLRKGFPEEELIRLSEKTGAAVIEITNTHLHLADLCANFYSHPEKKCPYTE